MAIIFYLLLLNSSFSTKDTLITAVYKTFIESKVEINFNNSKDLATKEDSLLFEFGSEILKGLEKEKFSITILDSITIYKDSALILSYPTESKQFYKGNSINIDVTTVLNIAGKFYNLSKNGTKLPWDEDINLNYIKTNNIENILGFNCEVFQSEDKSTKLWVCSSLTYLLNPGVQIGGIKGAILKYEISKPHQIISSVISTINFKHE